MADTKVMSKKDQGPLSGVEQKRTEGSDAPARDGLYARYVLIVLCLVYVLNFLDRQILAILAEDIKADLGISDANLGFLFGTAFAVFYATFGITFGRLADVWNRKRLISLGLGFWSLMTALSATARGFFSLATFRFGVGIGEASATPAAFSMLYDYFSPKVRTTVVAVYGCGLFVGSGLGILVGGFALDGWNNAWPDPALAPFGMKGWQATFLIVGLPGVIMALWVSTLKEPVRGQGDGIVSKEVHPHPFREALKVLMSMLPLTNFWIFLKDGGGRKTIITNVIAALVILVVVRGLTLLTGDVMQWGAVGFGAYAVFSWAQALAVRDPVIFGLIFKSKAMIYMVIGGGAIAFKTSMGFWAVPFFQRYYNVSPSELGAVLGIGFIIAGVVGVVLGGVLADKLRAYTSKGKLYVALGSVIVAILCAVVLLSVHDLTTAYVAVFVVYMTGAMAYGPGNSTVNDLIIPRGRAVATAFYAMAATLLGVALGPYVIGHISDLIAVTGVDDGEALRQAMLWGLLMPLGCGFFIFLAIRNIEGAEATLLDRARALGEDI